MQTLHISLPDETVLTVTRYPVESSADCAGATPGSAGVIPVLLMPGTFGDASVYDDVRPHLLPYLDVAVMKFREYAEDIPEPESVTMATLSDDAVAVADALEWERFYVGGHSLGGMVAVDMLRACPERVRGAISIEGWTSHHVAKDAFGGVVVGPLPDAIVQRRRSIRERVLKDWTDEQQKEFATIWRRWDGYDTLRNTDIPVLELWGDRGAPLPSMEAMRIPEKPGIRVEWMTGASHPLLQERPKEVAEEINRFIRDTSG